MDPSPVRALADEVSIGLTDIVRQDWLETDDAHVVTVSLPGEESAMRNTSFRLTKIGWEEHERILRVDGVVLLTNHPEEPATETSKNFHCRIQLPENVQNVDTSAPSPKFEMRGPAFIVTLPKVRI